MLSTALQAAALWTALLLLLLMFLAIRVVGQRRAHKVLIGDGGQASLTVAQRAFGNATEYVPAGIAALILMSVLHSSYYLVHLVGLLLFVGRLLHAFGMTADRLTAGRMVGMILTFAAYTIAAILLLLKAFAVATPL